MKTNFWKSKLGTAAIIVITYAVFAAVLVLPYDIGSAIARRVSAK